MLPPFVPPSARKANDRLPSINDFVVDTRPKPVEETVAPLAAGVQNAITGSSSDETPTVASLSMGGAENRGIERGGEVAPSVGTSSACNVVRPAIEYSNSLPSIEEFVARAPYVAKPGMASGAVGNESQFVQIGLSSSRVDNDAQAAAQSKELHPVVEAALEGSHGSIDSVEHIAASESTKAAQVVAPPIQSLEVVQPSALNTENVDAKTVSSQGGAVVPPTADASVGNDWVEAERDSFDWQSVANLATSPAETLLNDEQRAEDAWMATDWSTPSSSPTEHIASVLLQLARRVRSGELEVDAPRGTSTEAAVAAVLTALLSQPNGFGDR